MLTSLIALLYGLFLKPYREPILSGRKIPKMFVVPDIYAVDCTLDIFIREAYEKFYKIQENDMRAELHYKGEGQEIKEYLERLGFEVKATGSILYASKR